VIDTHCHLNFDSFDGDRPEVIARASAAGVTRIIIPAVDRHTSEEATALADSSPNIYAAVGIHPNSTANFADSDIEWIDALANQRQRGKRIVSIGEIGLDYYWKDSPKPVQRRAFEAQLELAARLELPVIIHNREASDDVINILESWANGLASPLKERPGVMHSFSAPMHIAERAVKAGFYLGFTGPITYKNADELRRIAAWIPLERILTETDAPFLTPTPHRGKRNEPSYIPLVVDRLASLRGMSSDEMAAITTANAERLFKLNLVGA